MSKSVLQVPFLLMTLMGYVTPTLDEMLVINLFSEPSFPSLIEIQFHAIHRVGRYHIHPEAQV